jgi:hypothetical protein
VDVGTTAFEFCTVQLSEAQLSAAELGDISRPAAASITSWHDGRSDVSPPDLASYTSHAGKAVEFSFLLHPFSFLSILQSGHPSSSSRQSKMSSNHFTNTIQPLTFM